MSTFKFYNQLRETMYLGLGLKILFLCLSVNICSCNITSVNFPLRFIYKTWEALVITVRIRNIPREATEYGVYFSRHCLPEHLESDSNYLERKCRPQKKQTAPIINDQDINVYLDEKLRDFNKMWVYLELKKNRTLLTSPVTIITGKSYDTHDPLYKYNNICANKEKRCEMLVDLRHEIDTLRPSDFESCPQGKDFKLSCESSEFGTDTLQSWYEAHEKKNKILRYKDIGNYQFNCDEDSRIKYGFIGLINTTSNTVMTYNKIQMNNIFNLVDNGTILCCLYYERKKRIKNYFAKKTLLYTENLKSGEIYDEILRYTDIGNLQFNCNEYESEKNLFIGLINTTSNTVMAYATTQMNNIFDLAENGTILCCLYYKRKQRENDVIFTRHIEKKTLLYKEHSKSDDDGTLGYAIIAIATAVGLAVLLLTALFFRKKLLRKKASSHDTANRILYADLDLVRGNNRRQIIHQESPYAQVIGFMADS